MTIHDKKMSRVFDKIKELIKFSSIQNFNDNYLKLLIGTDNKLPIGKELSLNKSQYNLEILLEIETYIIPKYYQKKYYMKINFQS